MRIVHSAQLTAAQIHRPFVAGPQSGPPTAAPLRRRRRHQFGSTRSALHCPTTNSRTRTGAGAHQAGKSAGRVPQSGSQPSAEHHHDGDPEPEQRQFVATAVVFQNAEFHTGEGGPPVAAAAGDGHVPVVCAGAWGGPGAQGKRLIGRFLGILTDFLGDFQVKANNLANNKKYLEHRHSLNSATAAKYEFPAKNQ
jgi:hypothetical protein